MAGTPARRRAGALALVALLAATLLAAGCASWDKPKPQPLRPLTEPLEVQTLWRKDIGRLDYAMQPVLRGKQLLVADGDGQVLALDADTGAELWRAGAGARITAGVGSDGRVAAVVTRGNELVAFEAGRELWRKRLPGSVLTPPLVAGERVFVLAVDRTVQAFDALDGRRLWTLQRPGEALTLAQAGVILPHRNTLLVGQGSRLTGVDPLTGQVQWDAAMASQRGSNEVERLADLVGPALRHGNQVCARAFQAAVACVDAARGSVTWTRNAGGAQAVGGSAEVIVGADASDRITAWKAASGDLAWSSESLLYRGLSGAAAVGPAVVFGDADGLLHFLALADGKALARVPTDGKPVLGAPLADGKRLFVVTAGGALLALRTP